MSRLLGELGKIPPVFAVLCITMPTIPAAAQPNAATTGLNLLTQSNSKIAARQVKPNKIQVETTDRDTLPRANEQYPAIKRQGLGLLAQSGFLFDPTIANKHENNPEWDLLNTIEQYQLNPPLSQVNSVDGLKDVSPQDWAYQALRGLVERYDCVTGFPDRTYRGEQTISRSEFASSLNACLWKVESLISETDTVPQKDIDLVLQLMQEFQSDLALLQGRTDALQAEVRELEVTQFSATTKLFGEAIFGVASILGGEGTNNPVLGDRLRLELVTSLTGNDLLFTRLATGNFPTFTAETGTFAGNLAFAAPEANDLNLEVLLYEFSPNDRTDIIIGARGMAADDIADTVNFLDGDGGWGALSIFGTRNPIFLPPGDAGLGIVHRPLKEIEISVGYLAAPANDPNPGSGLFNGPYSALGQILFAPTEQLSLAATYVHSYNQNDTLTGSNVANLLSLSATPRFLSETVPTLSNSYGIELSWSIGDRLIIGGWGGLSKVKNLSALGNSSDLGTLDIWNWAATLALPDLGKEGNLGGIILGMEPSVKNSTIENIEEAPDSSVHLEAFYQYQINDNISITPGVVWITDPDNNQNNDDLVIGTVRTTFNF